MNRSNVIKRIRSLSLPSGQYVMVGGASLTVRGIRETQDIDIVVFPELFDELLLTRSVDEEFQQKWDRRRIKQDKFEIYTELVFHNPNLVMPVKDLINSADIIDGIPFQNLDSLMTCKLDVGRAKDQQDIELITKHLVSSTDC